MHGGVTGKASDGLPMSIYSTFHIEPLHSMFNVDGCTFLYTKGYVPELKTYPGVHLPAPFEVTKAIGDSSLKEIFKELLDISSITLLLACH